MTPSRASGQPFGTGRCWTQRPPPSSSDAGMKVASGSQIVARRSPHRLRFGPHHADLAIALIFKAVAAIDQPPVGPRLGDDRLQWGHAAASPAASARADRRDGNRSCVQTSPRLCERHRHRRRATGRASHRRATMRPKTSIDRASMIGAALRGFEHHQQACLELSPRASDLDVAQILCGRGQQCRAPVSAFRLPFRDRSRSRPRTARYRRIPGPRR